MITYDAPAPVDHKAQDCYCMFNIHVQMLICCVCVVLRLLVSPKGRAVLAEGSVRTPVLHIVGIDAIALSEFALDGVGMGTRYLSSGWKQYLKLHGEEHSAAVFCTAVDVTGLLPTSGVFM